MNQKRLFSQLNVLCTHFICQQYRNTGKQVEKHYVNNRMVTEIENYNINTRGDANIHEHVEMNVEFCIRM